jgi:asparagine synthase (glutamine-hydrolysing)
LKDLYKYDVLRANKSTQAWGLEARVPFLDKEFLEVAMNIDPQEKMITKDRIEKWVLRSAFEGDYLPDEILWRQKEQFSDGVGYGWIDGLKDYAERMITDQQLQSAKYCFPDATPQTKEAYLYRQIFSKHYPQQSATATVPWGKSIACSTPAAIAWDAAFQANADASGRALLGVHVDAKRFADAAAANGAAKKQKLG